jgi:hypothetical protein
MRSGRTEKRKAAAASAPRLHKCSTIRRPELGYGRAVLSTGQLIPVRGQTVRAVVQCAAGHQPLAARDVRLLSGPGARRAAR